MLLSVTNGTYRENERCLTEAIQIPFCVVLFVVFQYVCKSRMQRKKGGDFPLTGNIVVI